jgi:predicted dehydrogenase
MTPLKLAVVGTGHLGRIHARLAAENPNIELAAVVDPVEHARTAVAEETGALPVADFRDIIGKVEAAVVATPTSTHHEVGMALLAGGVHLLIEKPIAGSIAEADDLVSAARERNRVLQVGHVERFNPALANVAADISQPKFIESVRISGFPFRSTDVGVVKDLMIHDLDVVLSLVQSPVVRVEALGVAVLTEHEDAASARVTFENGCVAQFTASRVSYRNERTMQVWSAGGFATVDYGLRNTTVVRPHADVLQHRFDVASLSPEEQSHLKRHLFEELLVKETTDGAEGNALADEQQDLVDSIRQGREPRVTGQQGRDALALAEEVIAQIEAHAWDGHAGGRLGSAVTPAAPILRPAHWAATDSSSQREAG